MNPKRTSHQGLQSQECVCGKPTCAHFKRGWKGRNDCHSKSRRCFCGCCCLYIKVSPNSIGGIQAQLQTANNPHLEHRDAIIFNQIIKHTNRHIYYNEATGEFCLASSGRYLINWDVAVEGSHHSPSITFAILTNGNIQNESTLPISVGQLNGCCFVSVTKEPLILSLVNNTRNAVQLSTYSPIANITITKIL